ncbi:hypothetical protein FPOAC2_03546 [Fusarium poae]|jgi:hypothetical protein|uniref:Uncharacterized protein n=1 Tax=Fusarium poae TaxID=36050 RepID=A0A1B8B9D4_FUSPO|nr:hypothetical protein FPOAC1_003436 [Fusarium poae]KAG8677419.1 hypothetical protein FPOAC1_003436 [Fusarium poae]OBS29330.1 hypothetical protein FPOA_03266 [Fusarium poae]
MMESASLLSLSPELIFQIVDHTNCPSTIFTLALTCSALHRQCQPALKQHHDAYNKYRITSDLSPETVLHLLRDGPTAEIERWHVRELEIWGSREGWEDWRSWDPKLPGSYGLAEEAPSRSALSAQELQTCTRKMTDWWERSEDQIDMLQRNLQGGRDSMLKMLLVASCPRLHSIRFAKRPNDCLAVLSWIAMAIEWCIHDKWPPGFESLQNMAVGVSVGVLPDEDDGMFICCSDIEKVLRLPNLKNLYICEPIPELEWAMMEEEGIDEMEDLDFEFDYLYDFPVRTSSVKCLFIDSPCDLPPQFYTAIVRAPKDLETLVIRERRSTIPHEHRLVSLLDDLSLEQPQLKQFIVYNGTEIGGEYTFPHLPCKFKAFRGITHFSIAASEIEHECYEITPPVILQAEEYRQTFPPSMEAIYVWGFPDLYYWELHPCENLDLLLARLIQSGGYKNLKVIYVDNVESVHRAAIGGLPITKEQEGRAFPKTLAAGREAGVHVCTLTNRDDGGYWKNFPARPDWFDLKTGSCGERPADWGLNLYTGEWGPDCKGCGECNKCLSVYPAERWKKMKNDVAA